MSQKISKKEAIVIAKNRVSCVFLMNGVGYMFDIFTNLGRYTVHPSDFPEAVRRRRQAMIDIAREHLGLDLVEYKGGSWTSYIYGKQ